MKVAVDPGHGMSNSRPGVYDPGAEYSDGTARFQEAAIALQYGLALADSLKAKGVAVFMTRDDAEDHAPYKQRARNAEAAGCNVFLALHLNSAEDHSANGAEVLYLKASDAAAAATLQRAVVRASRLRDRGTKQRPDLAVLHFSGPAFLVELGFIGNDEDRQALTNPAMRHTIAEAIADWAVGAFPNAAAGPQTLVKQAPRTTKRTKRSGH